MIVIIISADVDYDNLISKISPSVIEKLFDQEKGIKTVVSDDSRIEILRIMFPEHKSFPLVIIDNDNLPIQTKLKQIKESEFEKTIIIKSLNNEDHLSLSLNPPKPKIMVHNSWTSKKIGVDRNNKKIFHRKILQKRTKTFEST